MTKPTPALDLSCRDPILDDLIYEITEKIESGKSVDLKRYAREHPEHIEQLRRLLPMLEVMIDLSRLSGDRSRSNAGGRIDEGLPRGVLGDYRILGEIGRGGMGVVYEAEQISLGRSVALKVLPFAAVMDRRQLQRFKNEAQAAAHLQHQNIVPVYAVGCERGVHFYAMQFVEGQSLEAVIRQLRRRAGLEQEEATSDPRPSEADRHDSGWGNADFRGGLNRVRGQRSSGRREGPDAAGPDSENARERPLSPGDTLVDQWGGLSTKLTLESPHYLRGIARLGLQAAEALEHAHGRDVVHRDIKPSNLLLDTEGNLWVTDFGLARIESEHSLTMTGDVLGTLRYMSPEQALGKTGVVDHRADIYSLGVTLYELLTLQPAFAGRNRQELLKRIGSEEPRSLRRANPAVPRDLETIVQKAMEKEPEDRYPSAEALASDLRRFLEDKPILARRPSLVQRAAKWSRRHMEIVSTAAVTVILALAVSTGLIWQERNKTAAAYEREKKERERAEANLDYSRNAIEDAFGLILNYDPNSGDPRDEALFQLLKLYRQISPEAAESGGGEEFQPRPTRRRLGEDPPAEQDYRALVATFEKLSQRATPNPQADEEWIKHEAEGVPLQGRTVAGAVGNADKLRDEASGLRLLTSTFVPGTGRNRRFPQVGGLALSENCIYLSGADTKTLGGTALALGLQQSRDPAAHPILLWQTHWPGAGFSQPGMEFFNAVAAGEDGVYFAGNGYHETIDSGGGKEAKAVLVKFPTGKAGEVDAQGPEWVATPNFFDYSGLELFRDLEMTPENGSVVLYVVGRGETSGNLDASQGVFNVAMVLAKYSGDGRLLGQATEEGVRFGAKQATGYSSGHGLTIANGHVFVVGQSFLTAFGEDDVIRPFLACYDTELNQIWRQRDGNVAGAFSEVTTVGGHVYAVGFSETPGDAESRNYLIQKYRGDSTRVWTTEFGGGGADELTDVVSLDGRLFAVGFTQSEGAGGHDAVIFEIDPDEGKVVGKARFGGPEDDRADAVATDGEDLYIAGTSRSFGVGGEKADGQSHAMLLRYAPEPAP